MKIRHRGVSRRGGQQRDAAAHNPLTPQRLAGKGRLEDHSFVLAIAPTRAVTWSRVARA